MARTHEWSDGTVRRQPEPASHVVEHPTDNPSYEAMKDANRKRADEESRRDIAEFTQQYCTGICTASRRGNLTGGMSESDVHNAGRPTEVPKFNKTPKVQPIPVEIPELIPVEKAGGLFAKLFGGK